MASIVSELHDLVVELQRGRCRTAPRRSPPPRRGGGRTAAACRVAARGRRGRCSRRSRSSRGKRASWVSEKPCLTARSSTSRRFLIVKLTCGDPTRASRLRPPEWRRARPRAPRRGRSRRGTPISMSLNAPGRSSIGTWPVSRISSLRASGIRRSNSSASPAGRTASFSPHTISVGQAISGSRSRKSYSRQARRALVEAGLAGALDHGLVGQVRSQPARVPRHQRQRQVPRDRPPRELAVAGGGVRR